MDQEWLLANWIPLAGGAGAAFMLLMVVVVIARSGGRTHQKRRTDKRGEAAAVTEIRPNPGRDHRHGAEHEAQAVSLAYNAGAELVGGWQNLQGQTVASGRDGLRLRSGANAISVGSASVMPGDDFICDYKVRLVKPSSNGAPVNFFVGAVFRDSGGAIVGYWVEQEAFAPGETERKGTTYSTAAKGAATVHAGAHGPWRQDHSHGDGEVEFTAIHVRRKARQSAVAS